MKLEDAIKTAKEHGFDWRISIMGDNEYFTIVYHGVDVAAYEIVDGDVKLTRLPKITDKFEKILSEFCDDPVYYEDEWWLNATCENIEVSLLLGIGTATDIIVRSLNGSLDSKIVQKLINIALEGVKYIYYSPNSIHIEFIDGDSIRVETIGGDKGLLSLAPADVEKIIGLYNGIKKIKEYIPSAQVSAYINGYTVSIHDETIELPPKIDFIIEKSKEYSRDDVKILPGSFIHGRPRKFFVIGEKYVTVVYGEENLEKYFKLRKILGDLGGSITDDKIEIISDSFSMVDDYISFNSFEILRELSKIIKLPERIKKYADQKVYK